MFPPSGPPPSRVSKMQLIAFLPDDLDAQLRSKAEANGDTFQQVLGRLINLELKSRGIDPVLSTDRQHVFVRRNSTAQPRTATGTAPTRKNRKSFAGWFDRNEVTKLRSLCRELGTNVQKLSVLGARRLIDEMSKP